MKSKSDISRPWNILEPKSELSEQDQSWLYTYDIKGEGKYTHLFHEK